MKRIGKGASGYFSRSKSDQRVRERRVLYVFARAAYGWVIRE